MASWLWLCCSDDGLVGAVRMDRRACLVVVALVLTLDGGDLRDGVIWLLLAVGAAAWMACLVGCA